MKLLFRWLVTSLAVLVAANLVPGVHVANLGAALTAAFVLGLLNLLVRPVLVLLTLPFTILTLGFFLLLINAGLFYFASSLVRGFEVESFGSAFFAALIISFVSWLMTLSIQRDGTKVTWSVKSPRPKQAIDLEQDAQGKWK